MGKPENWNQGIPGGLQTVVKHGCLPCGQGQCSGSQGKMGPENLVLVLTTEPLDVKRFVRLQGQHLGHELSVPQQSRQALVEEERPSSLRTPSEFSALGRPCFPVMADILRNHPPSQVFQIIFHKPCPKKTSPSSSTD